MGGDFTTFLDKLASVQKALLLVIGGSLLASLVSQIGLAGGIDPAKTALFATVGALAGIAGIFVQWLVLFGSREERDRRIIENHPRELAYGIFVRIGLSILAAVAFFGLARVDGPAAFLGANLAIAVAFGSFFAAFTGAVMAFDLAEAQDARWASMSDDERLAEQQHRAHANVFLADLESDNEKTRRALEHAIDEIERELPKMEAHARDQEEIVRAVQEDREPVGLSPEGQADWDRNEGRLRKLDADEKRPEPPKAGP